MNIYFPKIHPPIIFFRASSSFPLMVCSHIFSKTAHSNNNDELKFKLKDTLILHRDSFTEDLPSFSAPPPPHTPNPPTLLHPYCLLSHIVKQHIKIKCFLNDVCLLNSARLPRECPSALHFKTPRTVEDEHATCSVAFAPPSVHVTPTVGQLRCLQPKLKFSGVYRPLSQRLHLPSLLLLSLTAVSCTVLPDLFTE